MIITAGKIWNALGTQSTTNLIGAAGIAAPFVAMGINALNKPKPPPRPPVQPRREDGDGMPRIAQTSVTPAPQGTLTPPAAPVVAPAAPPVQPATPVTGSGSSPVGLPSLGSSPGGKGAFQPGTKVALRRFLNDMGIELTKELHEQNRPRLLAEQALLPSHQPLFL
jgi:hypothetical protein